MFKHMGNGSLRTVVTHPHDPDRVIFLSFDPCHVIKNIRSHFLERQLTDGCDVISGTYVQKLYEYQKSMTVKLARNLTRKHAYPTNLENKMCCVLSNCSRHRCVRRYNICRRIAVETGPCMISKMRTPLVF
ncbi:hypothetical protein MTO96_047409 [Rhipicephalus appendiculatus]